MSGQFPACPYQRSQMHVSQRWLARHVRTLFKSRFEIDRNGGRRERRFLRDEDDIFRAGFFRLALHGIPSFATDLGQLYFVENESASVLAL